MKQYEAVIQVMEKNGGYATLGYLYQEVLKVPNVIWNTKTPFASIRRIVQDKRFFFKIRPGLWALKSYKNNLPNEILNLIPLKELKSSNYFHSYYQGLIVEIGNLQSYQTFIPNQDKRKIFLNKKLGDLASLNNIFNFTYKKIVDIAKTIDVIWFNQRNMPKWFFEIEHSSDLRTSLLKFLELQDFNSKFIIVAHEKRQQELQDKLTLSTFDDLKKRVEFWSYDFVSNLHSKTFEYYSLVKSLKLS